jgi:hypothetical protein
MTIASWQLTEFNLDGQIDLGGVFGLVKVHRADDGLLTLVGNADYGVPDQKQATPAEFLRTDPLLGFVLDIGIQRTKTLTMGSGFYLGLKLIHAPQSPRKVSQQDFDKALFDAIGNGITRYYQSGDRTKEHRAIRAQFLLEEYNNARLLYPNFHAESYLSMMRLIDALANRRTGYGFAAFAAAASPTMNRDVYTKLQAVEAFKNRIPKAMALFTRSLANRDSARYRADMTGLDDAGKVVFACLFSAYMYRNKFTHQGFPFPDTVKEAILGSTGAPEGGMAYLHPSEGIFWSRFHRPGGLQPGDLIDIHEVVGVEAQDFKDTYFLLLPSWHFLKKLAREALLKEVTSWP